MCHMGAKGIFEPCKGEGWSPHQPTWRSNDDSCLRTTVTLGQKLLPFFFDGIPANYRHGSQTKGSTLDSGSPVPKTLVEIR